MKLRLIKDARRLWYRFWSVRLNAIAVILAAVYAGFEYYATGNTPLMALGLSLFNLAAGVSRVVAQDSLHDDYANAP
jgi:hypothetical protein